jgi:ketosteroid isomerase-like protein
MNAIFDRIADAYAAFNRRDIDGALAAMHPDVEWENGMEGGFVRGHDAVRSYWPRQWELIDPRVEPVAFAEDQGGRIVVNVHQTVRDTAGTLLVDQHVQHVYSLRDGLVSRMKIRGVTAHQPAIESSQATISNRRETKAT